MTMSDLTPFERGYEAGLEGAPAPQYPTTQSTRAEKLYERGWSAGVDARNLRKENRAMTPHPFYESNKERE